MELKTVTIYEFGPFRLEPGEHRLLCNGQHVSLTPKTFDLLLYLVDNHGRLVYKDQIMHAIWQGSFVEEANLTVSVSALRKTLARNDAGRQYIETVPKKGYRFTAPVKLARNAESTASVDLPASDLTAVEPDSYGDEFAVPISPAKTRAVVSRKRLVFVGLIALACCLALGGYLRFLRDPQHSLAVLPLHNLRQDAASDFLGFSLADAIITKLDLLSSVTVRPSSIIQKYKARDIDIKKIGRDLNVDTVLTGNYIRDGDRLRITYQLIDVPSYKILCRDVIDVKYDELLAVHDNVSKQIISALRLNLSPVEAARIRPDAPVNPLAYEYYLRGIDLMASHNFPVAVKMLEKSAEIDPTYALTWAYLGQSYTSDASFEMGGREQYRRAKAAYERALALQPKQLEAEMFLANLLVDTGKVEEAVPLLRDAIARSPNNAAVHWELGYAYRFAGMLTQSLGECESARHIDPVVKSNGSVLNTYLYLGEYDKFIESLPNVNGSAFFRFYRGFGEYHQGEWQAATEDFNRAYQEDRTLYTGIGKAFADALEKKAADGVQLLRELETNIEHRGVGDPEATYKVAQAYVSLGDNASGLRTLRSSIESGFFPYPYFLTDPLLDKLRDLPEFPAVMNSARERHEAFKRKFF